MTEHAGSDTPTWDLSLVKLGFERVEVGYARLSCFGIVDELSELGVTTRIWTTAATRPVIGSEFPMSRQTVTFGEFLRLDHTKELLQDDFPYGWGGADRNGAGAGAFRYRLQRNSPNSYRNTIKRRVAPSRMEGVSPP